MKESKIVVASSVWSPMDKQFSNDTSSIFSKIERTLQLCEERVVKLVVFPALIGTLFEGERYLEHIRELSSKHQDLYICPGSFWEEKEGRRYHSSCLIYKNQILLWQRQLYLSKWEQEYGLSRGTEISQVDIEGFQTCIILSTDVFYPQVSRHAALSGTDLVLSPVAIKGEPNPCSQLRGLWQNVQSNMFFAVESGFKGTLSSLPFYSHSVIHAPLALTSHEDGFLIHEEHSITPDSAEQQHIIVAQLDNGLRNKRLIDSYNPLRQLNPTVYSSLF